jgi:CO/xanthine dehydrogenase Mo-binding subunit
MDVVLVENPYAGGPFGAKGLGELPMDGPAPAIVNAIRSLGFDVREVPALPEVLLRESTAARGAGAGGSQESPGHGSAPTSGTSG